MRPLDFVGLSSATDYLTFSIKINFHISSALHFPTKSDKTKYLKIKDTGGFTSKIRAL